MKNRTDHHKKIEFHDLQNCVLLCWDKRVKNFKTHYHKSSLIEKKNIDEKNFKKEKEERQWRKKVREQLPVTKIGSNLI